MQGFLSVWVAVGAITGVTMDDPGCPAYEAIRQPSVAANAFKIEEFQGIWYMVATTEPTLPTFCVCGVNNVSVDVPSGSYSYINTDYCGHLNRNISLAVAGKLSPDPETPGSLRENAALLNNTGVPLDPNYIFAADRDPATGKITVLYTYACLGRLPPIVGKYSFSFNVLARSYHMTNSSIAALVARANSTTNGQLALDGIRFNDQTRYAGCGFAS